MKEVKIKYNKSLIDGLLYKDSLTIPADVKIGETLNIDGVDTKVLSSQVNLRDNIQIINLANASKPKEIKSDGESTEG
tara:strand:- start:213 stop:446 length:234 start_codon:yes stop_codon:yes gene_type:complete